MRSRGPETRDPGAYTFHYNRSERLARGGVERDATKESGGLFKRNRSLAIILIDLAVILIIYGLYVLFFAPSGNAARIAGHDLTLRAFSFGDEVYVTVRAEGNDDGSTDPVAITITGDDSPPTVIRGVLPGAGSEVAYRAILGGSVDRVEAAVAVGEATTVLAAEVDAD